LLFLGKFSPPIFYITKIKKKFFPKKTDSKKRSGFKVCLIWPRKKKKKKKGKNLELKSDDNLVTIMNV